MSRRVVRPVLIVAGVVFLSSNLAGQAIGSPFPLPRVQLGPKAPLRPVPAPQRPPVTPRGAIRLAPPAQLPPPQVRCTMKIVPVDPTIDPDFVRQPDTSVDYAKKKVPPPVCR